MLFDLATERDDPELRRLLRESPMAGDIRVTLEREPNVFRAAGIEGHTHQVIVARDEDSGRLLGMGSRSILDAWINGRPARLGYLSQLRVDASRRGSPRGMRRGFEFLHRLHQDGAAPFYVTTVVEDNLPARRLLEAGLTGFPTYRPLGRLSTLVLPVRRRTSRGRERSYTIEPGTDECLAEIVACLRRNGSRFQFAPCWTTEHLRSDERTRDLHPEDFFVARRGDAIVACLACWDQRGFKQSVVRGYSRRIGVARPLLNLFRSPRLPAPGGSLRGAFISHVAADGDDAEVVIDLVARVQRHALDGPFDHLIVGFEERNPLLAAVARAYPHRVYRSVIYAVHWSDAADAVARLDGRLPHLEAAIL